MHKESVDQIVSAIGLSRLAAELGVSHHSIRAAKNAGSFPASWYATVRQLCDRHDVPCALAAFNWRKPVEEMTATHEDQGPSA